MQTIAELRRMESEASGHVIRTIRLIVYGTVLKIASHKHARVIDNKLN